MQGKHQRLACRRAEHPVGATISLAALALALSLACPGRAAAGTGWPDGVPDLLAPGTASAWEAMHVGDVEGNPDLPVLLFVHRQGEEPRALLVGLDARNGRETYTLGSDPVIFVAVLADPDPTTVTVVYYDTGFAAAERPSGQFQEVGQPALDDLPPFVRAIVPTEGPLPAGMGAA